MTRRMHAPDGADAEPVVEESGRVEPAADASSGSAAPNRSFTIDELSQHTGVPGRTIRFYQSQGVLPSPRREGRVAFYDEDHVRRLHLIADLRHRGLRLDAIRDALEQLESGGDSLKSWLGLSERFSDPWTEDRPLLLSAEELLGRYGGGRPGLLADLERIGLIHREGSGVRPSFLVETIGFVDAVVALEQAGIELSVSIESAEIMRRSVAALAEELVTYYAGFFKQDLPSGGVGTESVMNAYAAIRPIGFETLRIMFGQAIDRSIRKLVEGGPVAIERIPGPPTAGERNEPT